MAKKKNTEEEKIIEEATNVIMHAIHVAAARIADKYERQLMTEVVSRIQIQMEANDDVKKAAENYINNKLNSLSTD
jgi:hypothetical protein